MLRCGQRIGHVFNPCPSIGTSSLLKQRGHCEIHSNMLVVGRERPDHGIQYIFLVWHRVAYYSQQMGLHVAVELQPESHNGSWHGIHVAVSTHQTSRTQDGYLRIEEAWFQWQRIMDLWDRVVGETLVFCETSLTHPISCRTLTLQNLRWLDAIENFHGQTESKAYQTNDRHALPLAQFEVWENSHRPKIYISTMYHYDCFSAFKFLHDVLHPYLF